MAEESERMTAGTIPEPDFEDDLPDYPFGEFGEESEEEDYGNEYERYLDEETDRNEGEKDCERNGNGFVPDEGRFFAVSVTRVRGGTVAETFCMTFSLYSYAEEWLRGNGFFIGENPYYKERMRSVVPGEWIHGNNFRDDFRIATVFPAMTDTGRPFLINGKPAETTLA